MTTEKSRENAIAAATANDKRREVSAWHETSATHVVTPGGPFEDELYSAVEDLEDIPVVDGRLLTWRLCPLDPGLARSSWEIRGSWVGVRLTREPAEGRWYTRYANEEWEKVEPFLIAEFMARVTHVLDGDLYSAVEDSFGRTGSVTADGHKLTLGLYSLHNWVAGGFEGAWPEIRGFDEDGEQGWYTEDQKSHWPELSQVWPVKVGEIPGTGLGEAELNAKARDKAREAARMIREKAQADAC